MVTKTPRGLCSSGIWQTRPMEAWRARPHGCPLPAETLILPPYRRSVPLQLAHGTALPRLPGGIRLHPASQDTKAGACGREGASLEACDRTPPCSSTTSPVLLRSCPGPCWESVELPCPPPTPQGATPDPSQCGSAGQRTPNAGPGPPLPD